MQPRTARGATLLEGLNPRQREAVVHAGTPLLIVAGAGSGKTRVLTHRIGWLLAERHVHPGEIMAITFTNKAAAEMKERVDALVGRRAAAMWVSTFHSMCVRILRREAKHLGVRSQFSVYDADDTRRLVGLVARDLELDPKKFAARGLAAQISNLKNELLGPEEAAERATNEYERRVAEVYALYQARLRSANAFDFDDLIMETVALLQRLPDVAEYYRRRFRHVLVDEYQDTNHAQYVLVRELVAPAYAGAEPGELCVVGDADQSIYAFRGASIRNITEFERDFRDAHTVLLEQNYRSTQTILTAANAVIARNPDRRDKRLWTAAGDGPNVVGYVADNEHDEAAFVAGEIDRLVDNGEIRNSDVAVFYRTNAQSRVFEDVFLRVGLPYKVVGGVRFYERREIRDALAYLRVLSNPDDTVSLRRILNVPKRGIGERAEELVAQYADRERISFAAALRVAAEQPERMGALATRSQRCIAGVRADARRRGRSSSSRARARPSCWRRSTPAPATPPSWRRATTRRTRRGWRTSPSWSRSPGSSRATPPSRTWPSRRRWRTRAWPATTGSRLRTTPRGSPSPARSRRSSSGWRWWRTPTRSRTTTRAWSR